MDFTSKRRNEDDEGGNGPARALPTLREEDLDALREIARAGGGKHHVRPKRVTASQLRTLRIEGVVELLDDAQGLAAAKLTTYGLQTLAAAPGATAR